MKNNKEYISQEEIQQFAEDFIIIFYQEKNYLQEEGHKALEMQDIDKNLEKFFNY